MQAFLLDRDGVINRQRADYVKCWDEFEFLPGVLPALARLATQKRPVLVLTNQSAVGRKIIRLSTLHEIHANLRTVVRAAGGRIDDFYICPHHPAAGCACRKPQPGLLWQAAAQYHLNLADCVFIGDSITDFQAAQAAGCPSMLVQSGLQGDRLQDVLKANGEEVPLFPNLAAAVDQIVTGKA